MKISAIDHSLVYRKFGKDLRSSRVAISKENKTNTLYLAAFVEDNPVGIVGYCYISDTHIRLKTDYVNPAFRRKKIYTDLWVERMNIIFKNRNVKLLSAYCTEYSLGKYVKEGFIVQSINNKGITYVKKQTEQ